MTTTGTRAPSAVPVRGEMVAVGLDIGGTKIAGGRIDRDGVATPVGSVPTTPYDGAANLAAVRSLLASPPLAGADVVGLSIATSSHPDGTLRDPHGWFGWQGHDIATELSTPDRPVFGCHDSVAGALAEHRHGAGAGHDDLLYVTVGTGVSHCFVSGGTAQTGAADAAYFSGYTLAAGCGRPGCASSTVEDLAAGPALASAYRDGAGRDARPVVAAAAAGDRTAGEVLEHGAWHLGALLSTLVLVYDPAVVVIGGGLGAGVPRYRERAVTVARELIVTAHGRRIPMVPAEFGNRSCWIGAADLAAEHAGLDRPRIREGSDERR